VPRTDPDTRAAGAHFLTASPEVVGRMVAAAGLAPGMQVLDVGAGMGAVTEAVAAALQPGGSVLAVERDEGLAHRLRERALPGVRVVQGDALAVRLPRPIDAVVANPPFRILPALLRRLLDHGFGRAVLVMPQELADRLTAEPGAEAYGRLTVQVALRARTRVLFPLRRKDFDPPPSVACCVAEVRPKAADPALDLAVLEEVLEAAWAEKARALRHSLAPLAAALSVPPATITAALAQTTAAGRPATEVSPWEFGEVAKAIGRVLGPR
jgi:16S rRNA (adenine1518-N6/adenine1519-N6)-dimethyltransferase